MKVKGSNGGILKDGFMLGEMSDEEITPEICCLFGTILMAL